MYQVRGWANTLKYSIKKTDVVLLLDGILSGIKARGVIIRNDNGSQFLAHIVREYLDKMNVIQEFTHIATPEENSYIESLHSSLERELIKRNWFENIYHARMLFNDYYQVYNFKRKHRSLKRRSPYHYIKTFFPDFSDKHPFALSGDLLRVDSVNGKDRRVACLAIEENSGNDKFVNSENQDLLLN